VKVSIITVVYNGKNTIEDCIKSAANQTYSNIEHIIIDGGSTDGTLGVIKRYEDKIAYWVSEPDNGLYEAMNKGLRSATGDIIGILNSDDMYADNSAIESVVRTITENNVDSCYGDLVYVDRDDTAKIKRQWKAGEYKKEKFKNGWMPPHPTFFCKKTVYEKYGLLNLDFPLAADYELMLRFLYRHGVGATYIPKVLVNPVRKAPLALLDVNT
jgi:Glycosyltransferases involved in cell wall biogenesis